MSLPSSTRTRDRRERVARATSAESALAKALTRRGIRYRREEAMGGGFVDFWIPSAQLAIEIDGPHHRSWGPQMARDVVKTGALCKRGITTIRFSNGEVLRSPDHAALRVADVIAAKHASSALFGSPASRRRSSRTRSRRI